LGDIPRRAGESIKEGVESVKDFGKDTLEKGKEKLHHTLGEGLTEKIHQGKEAVLEAKDYIGEKIEQGKNVVKNIYETVTHLG